MYVYGIEGRLAESGLHFNHTHTENANYTQYLPVLLYADDTVLLAVSSEELQPLLYTCAEKGT